MKRSFFAPIFAGILLVTAAAAGGCGGSDDSEEPPPPPPPRNATVTRTAALGDGDDFTLVDGTLADVIEYVPPQDNDVQVTLTSGAYDPYLVVVERFPDGSLSVITQNDDISPQDYNAQLRFRAVRGATYQIVANSFAYAQGTYNLTVTDSVIPVSGDGTPLPDPVLTPPPADQDRTLRGIRKVAAFVGKRSVSRSGGGGGAAATGKETAQ